MKPTRVVKEIWNRIVRHVNIPIIRYMTVVQEYWISTKDKEQSQQLKTFDEVKNTKAAGTGTLMDDLRDVIVYLDICGPTKHSTIQRGRYFLVMVAALR